MYVSQSLLPVLLALATTGHAHGHDGDAPIPGLFGSGGRKLLSELVAAGRAEMAANSGLGVTAQRAAEAPSQPQRRDELDRRQVGGTDGQCGPGLGSCASGYCCSPEGWCGLTSDYCSAPDCQIDYGDGCDANQKPSGLDTTDVERPHLGSVDYGGVGIYSCNTVGDIAITFDDGPYNYTGDLLDKFASYGAKATFFITGNNLGKGMINDYSKPWAGYIQRMIAEGHQVASHTWSHQNQSQLTDEQYRQQIIWNEIAFNDILGFFPTYMRPPYSICAGTCPSILSELGYHITYFDLDTEGYLHDDPTEIQTSKDIWDDAIDNSDPASQDFLMIEHDIHYQTVYNLTDYVLTGLFAKGYRSVTVGECLGDPEENWYRAGPNGTNSSSTSSISSISSTATSSIPSTTIRPTSYSSSSSDEDDNSVTSVLSVASSTGPVSVLSSSSIAPRSTSATTTTAPETSTASVASTSAASATPSTALEISVDGTCGDGKTCIGSEFGNCCSQYGWCGSTTDYCGDSCQNSYGVCYRRRWSFGGGHRHH